MKGFCVVLLVAVLFTGFAGRAAADITPSVEIFYTLQQRSDLGSNAWEYDYTVKNNSLTYVSFGNDVGVAAFDIFFPACNSQSQWPDLKPSDAGLFSNVLITDSPGGWSTMSKAYGAGNAHPPVDAAVSALDAFTPSAFILKENQPVTGFSATFDYAGPGTPGDQEFTILDPSTFDPIPNGDGRTEANPVPQPPIILLLGTGISSLALLKKIFSSFQFYRAMRSIAPGSCIV